MERSRPADPLSHEGSEKRIVYVSRFGRDLAAKGHDPLQPAGPVSETLDRVNSRVNHDSIGRSSYKEEKRAANLRDERVRPHRSTSNERNRQSAEPRAHSNYMRQLQEHKYGGAEEQASAIISAKYIQHNVPTTLSDTYVSKADAFNISQQFGNEYPGSIMKAAGAGAGGSRAGSVGKMAADQPTTFRSRIECLLPDHLKKDLH